MIATLKKLYSLLNKRERRITFFLILATIFEALIQVVGIGSIMPFLAIVANPDAIEENRWLNMLYTYFGFNSNNAFLIFLGVGALVILTFGNVLQIGIQWLMLRFINMQRHVVSMRLLKNYLEKPYTFFLDHNSSDLGKNILSEVRQMIDGLFKPVMEILSKGMVVLFIIILLFIVNPILALSVVIFLGGTYLLIFLKIKEKLSDLGAMRRLANIDRFRTTHEAFGGIKEIKLMNNQNNFIKMYEKSSLRVEKTKTMQEVYSLVPDNALQTIAFGGILIIVLYLLIIGGNISQTLPIVGLYGYAILRLKPALQIIYSSFSKIKFYESSFEEIYEDLKLYTQKRSLSNDSDKTVSPLPFREKLQLDNIHFRYSGAKESLFNGIDMTIQANTSVAFIGATGSGKTTLVDIILGLLPPNSGQLKVDDIIITPKNLINWQRNLGYVPQHIYLSDDTVRKNIAFGIPREKIDSDLVIKSARMGYIHDFIVDEMPDGYDTVIGERGIRLSGGQRQRIGIARALYRDPKILILDEATNALDGETEDYVFQAIEKIAQTKTVIMIAHRLSTVKYCDRIYFLDKGNIVAEGTYDELVNENERFRTFTKFTESSSDTRMPEAMNI